jgi:hypothetical protein
MENILYTYNIIKTYTTWNYTANHTYNKIIFKYTTRIESISYGPGNTILMFVKMQINWDSDVVSKYKANTSICEVEIVGKKYVLSINILKNHSGTLFMMQEFWEHQYDP